MGFEEETEEDFDYQEGIGSFLKEKERVEFSLVKTVIVAVSLITVLGLSLSLVFKVTKNLFVKPPKIEHSVKHIFKDQFQEPAQSPPSSPITQVPVTKEAVLQPSKPSFFSDGNGDKQAKNIAVIKDDISPSRVSAQKPRASQRSEALTSLEGHELYRVVVAAFFDYEQAKDMLSVLDRKGVDSYIWTYKGGDRPVYRLQVGAFKELSSARDLESKMTSKGLEAYVIKK